MYFAKFKLKVKVRESPISKQYSQSYSGCCLTSLFVNQALLHLIKYIINTGYYKENSHVTQKAELSKDLM